VNIYLPAERIYNSDPVPKITSEWPVGRSVVRASAVFKVSSMSDFKTRGVFNSQFNNRSLLLLVLLLLLHLHTSSFINTRTGKTAHAAKINQN